MTDPLCISLGKEHASISSTFGANETVAQLVARLKSGLIKSPRSYQGRPCTVIAVVGFKGSGKSTFINTLVSLLCGSPVSVQRCNDGAEATAGTTSNLLIPVHQHLFPNTSPPPFYFFIWDTVGIDYAENVGGDARRYTLDEVAGLLRALQIGNLPSYGATKLAYEATTEREPMPAQMVFVLAHAKHHIQSLLRGKHDVGQASLIKNAQAVCSHYARDMGIPDHFKGLPLYVVATCFDELFAVGNGPFSVETGADQWSAMEHEPNVVAAVKHLSTQCDVPYSRTYISFGLDTLRPNASLADTRQLAALVPVVNAVQEAVLRDVYFMESRRLLSDRDGWTAPKNNADGQPKLCSLPYMSVSDLEGYFAGSKEFAAAAPIVKTKQIDGRILVRQSPATIREEFNDKTHFGLCERLIALIAPYHDT